MPQEYIRNHRCKSYNALFPAVYVQHVGAVVAGGLNAAGIPVGFRLDGAI